MSILLADLYFDLRRYQLPLSRQQAWEYLGLVRSVCDLLALFAELFPDQFARARAQGLALFPPPGEPYSVYERRFFQLVAERLFPLDLDYLYDDPSEDRRFYQVPVEPFGIDLSYDGEVEYYRLGWKLMFLLLGMVDAAALRGAVQGEETADEVERALDLYIRRGMAAGDLLQLRCEAQSGPLAFCWMAVAMADHSTGSVWLDATAEMPCDNARWEREDLLALAEQYQDALRLHTQAGAFLAWLEEDPYPHFKEVTRLWNTCVRDQTQSPWNRRATPPILL